MGAVHNDRPETLLASALAFPAKVVVRYPPPFIEEEGQFLLPLFRHSRHGASLKQKSAHFSRNSRNRRIADFSVVFRGDFQGKSGHRAARKSPVVLRIGQTTPYRIVVFRYQFGVHFRRFSLMSFLPLALTTAFRSLWYARCGQGSSISLPQVVALHRRGAYPIQAGHSIGIIHR